MLVDLHSHSTASDGELAPASLVALAKARGVTHLGLTDHDTVRGLESAAMAAKSEGISLVPGIEITATLAGREVHVLGLCVLPTAPGLVDWCGARGQERLDRLERMLEALDRAGVKVRLSDVLDEAGGAAPARPHIARVLVRSGYAASQQEAFDRFLVPGASGHVERARPTAAEAVRLVRSAGGVASLAHPGTNRVGRGEIADLPAIGFDAVEAVHNDHPPTQVDAYIRWAAAAGLRHTGGSDFHGPVSTPDLHPGLSRTPPAELAALARIAADRQEAPALAAARDEWIVAGGWDPRAIA